MRLEADPRDLDPHRVAEASPPKLASTAISRSSASSERLEVRVARDAEGAAPRIPSRKEPAEEVSDDPLKRDEEPALADGHEAGQELGHLHPRESPFAAVWIADEYPQRQRES
jgi:hypothetical protein